MKLSDEQTQLRDTARKFMEEQCTAEFVREMEKSELGFSREMWQQMAEMGWLGIGLPEECGGLGMAQGFRFAANNTLVDDLKLRIAARACDIARVPDFIARFKKRNLITDGFDDTACVPADDARRIFNRTMFAPAATNFRIDRIYGDRFHSNEDVMAGGLRPWHIDIKKRIGRIDR